MAFSTAKMPQFPHPVDAIAIGEGVIAVACFRYLQEERRHVGGIALRPTNLNNISSDGDNSAWLDLPGAYHCAWDRSTGTTPDSRLWVASPDSHLYVVALDNSQSANLLKVAGKLAVGERDCASPAPYCTYVTPAPQGACAAAVALQDGTVALVDTDHLAVTQRLADTHPGFETWSCAWLDAHTLASAGDDATVALYDLRAGARVGAWGRRVHDAGVPHVVAAGDGRSLLSASYDGVVRRLEPGSWRFAAESSEALADGAFRVAELGDGRFAVAGMRAGLAVVDFAGGVELLARGPEGVEEGEPGAEYEGLCYGLDVDLSKGRIWGGWFEDQAVGVFDVPKGE